MPRIPFGNAQLQGQSINPTNADTAGSGALKALGSLVSTLGGVMEQQQRESDQIALQKAIIDMKAADNDALHNGETGYLYRNGEKAISTAKDVYQSHIDNVQNIASRFEGRADLAKQFSLAADQNSIAFSRTVMDHYGQQKNKLANDQLNTMLEQGVTSTSTLYNDPTALHATVEGTIKPSVEILRALGTPEDTIKLWTEQSVNTLNESALKGLVANMALAGVPPAEGEKALRASYPFNQVNEITQAKYIKQYKVAASMRNAEDRANLNIAIRNNINATQNGDPNTIPYPKEEFIRVLGKANGEHEWNAYQIRQKTTENIAAFKTASNSELERVAKYVNAEGNPNFSVFGRDPSIFPETNDPDYSSKMTSLRFEAAAAQRYLSARSKDPMGQAQVEDAIPEIDLTDVVNLPDNLSNRYVRAVNYINDKGIKNFKMLSDTERLQLTNGLNNMAPTERVNFLETIAKGFSGNPEGYRALMREVGENNPAYATIGDLLANQTGYTSHAKGWLFWQTNNDVSGIAAGKYIFSGLEAQKPTDKGGTGRKLSTQANDTFKYLVDTSIYQGEQGDKALAAIEQTSRAYYIGKAIEQGAYNKLDDPDTTLMKEAIEITSGKTSSKFSVKVPLGMSSRVADASLNAEYNKYAKANDLPTTANGADLSDYNLVTSYTPGGTADGRYFLYIGSKAVHDKKGNPVVLDIRYDPNPLNLQEIPE